MIKSILPSIILWLCLCLTTLLNQTLAGPEADAKHLAPISHEHKRTTSTPRQGGVHERRRRGGRNYLSRRCKASKHSHGSKSPAAHDPANPNSVSPDTSKKWGLGWPNGDASYLANFARPKVRYLYTWSPYLPSGVSEFGIEGIPMLWGPNQVDDFKTLLVQGYGKRVLGMNEPNEPSQSNMSPEEGISLWREYINPLKSQGYYLISPACTNDQAGLDWMKAFVEGCTDCTIDAIAFHFYGTDPKAFIEHATTLHDTYDKPIWITEFADQNFSGNGGQASMAEIYAFQGEVVRFVENTVWIEAAFPFGVMHDLQGVNEGNSLLTGDGWPTSLAYNYFG